VAVSGIGRSARRHASAPQDGYGEWKAVN
jgi:hypothetical protein